METAVKWRRFQYLPVLPLGRDGRTVTGSAEHIALSRAAAAEGAVLLKNEGGLLPLRPGARVALFGKACADYVKGGGGSGDTNTAYVLNLCDAMEDKAREGKIVLFAPLCGFYRKNVEAQYAQGRRAGETKEPAVPEELFQRAASECDTAVISICRYSSEGSDRRGGAEDGDFYLSREEKALVESVTRSFARVAVVLNVGGVVDSSWFVREEKLPSVLLTGQGGMEGAGAAADILCGDVDPSGKLTDTFARSFEDYPSSQNFHESDDHVCYTDDIYVGYRYFETVPGAAERVNYPFGFGLSYTAFKIDCMEAAQGDGYVRVRVRVTNTGGRAGKEVIQLYTSPRGCRMDSPRVELRAFRKTRLLAAGESGEYELGFALADLAAYDEEKAAWVLQKGSYAVLLGNCVRDTREIYTVGVAEERLIRQVRNRCVPHELPRRLKADGAYEELPTRKPRPYPEHPDWPEKMGLHAEHILPDRREVPPAEGRVTMKAVLDGEAALDDVLTGLTDDELVTLAGGTPNRGMASTRGLGGLDDLGIPAVMTADGPAGLRLDLDRGVKTTAWPTATVLAATWNTDLAEAVGRAGALEVKENNIGVWLTPAVNIHRSPLCGRNFEYYSEDPLLAGKMAASMIRGIQSENISACVKHLCANNKETNRKFSDSRVRERALREIYLRPFELAVKEGHVWCVMTAYNLVNGVYTSENAELITGILREEWGYDGLVITDWRNRAEPYREYLAGNDVRMPFGSPRRLKAAMGEGLITREDLMKNVRRTLELFMKLE